MDALQLWLRVGEGWPERQVQDGPQQRLGVRTQNDVRTQADHGQLLRIQPAFEFSFVAGVMEAGQGGKRRVFRQMLSVTVDRGTRQMHDAGQTGFCCCAEPALGGCDVDGAHARERHVSA